MQPDIQKLTEQIDIKYYIDVILSRKTIFIAFALMPVLLGMSYLFFIKKPVYRAIAQVEMSAGVKMPVYDAIYRDRARDETYPYLTKQIQIMDSDTLKERVLKALAPEWSGKLPQKLFEDPNVRIQIARSNVIEVWVDSPNSQYALAYLNMLLKEFMKRKMERQEKSSHFALYNITTQADALNKKITEVQGRLQAFRSENDDVLIEERGSFLSSYLLKLNNKLSDLKTERLLVERQIKVLEETKDPALWISVIEKFQQNVVTPAISKEAQGQRELPAPAQPGDDTQLFNVANRGMTERLPFVFVLEKGQNLRWEGLKTRYEKLRSESARYAGVLRSEHPKMVELNKEIESVASDMDSEVKSVLDKFKAKYESIKLEEQVLQDEITRWQKVMLESFTKTNQLSALKEEESRVKKLYDLLIQRMEEIRVSADFGLETVLLLEDPRVKPVSPRIFRNLLLFIGFGLGLGCGAVFLLDYMDDSIKTADDLKKYVELPGLAVVYSIDWDKKNISSHKITDIKDEHVMESYRSLRTNILLSRPDKISKTILFTSSLPSEGKTTTAVNTAIVLAQGGLRVLLIDGDLRRPSVHKMFSIKNERGFSSVLLGKEKAEDCVRKTDMGELDIIPAGPHVPDPAKLFHFANMKELVGDMSKRYDKVIIDSAPVLTVVDSVVISDWVDSIVFVVHGGVTSRMALIKAKEMLLSNAPKLLGAVVNNLSYKRARHHYYYGYGYKYGYKYKYRYGHETKEQSGSNEKELEREVEETVV